MIMRKVLLVFVAVLAAMSAFAGAGILRPVEVNIDVNNLPNGEYAVCFDPTQVKTTAKGNYIEFEIFTLDLFDAKLVNELEKGDCIIADDKMVVVKTVKKEEGYVSVNYGMEGMTDFGPYDKTHYIICGANDNPTYTSQGKVKLLVPITVGMTDNGIDGDPMKTKVIKGSKLGYYLRHSWSNDFFQLNTTITVKNGKVTKLTRNYIP